MKKKTTRRITGPDAQAELERLGTPPPEAFEGLVPEVPRILKERRVAQGRPTAKQGEAAEGFFPVLDGDGLPLGADSASLSARASRAPLAGHAPRLRFTSAEVRDARAKAALRVEHLERAWGEACELLQRAVQAAKELQAEMMNDVALTAAVEAEGIQMAELIHITTEAEQCVQAWTAAKD